MTSAGKRIAAARTKAKLTGKELAGKAKVTSSWVRSVETGRTAQPAPDKLSRVADVLGLDIRELLALTDQLGAAATLPVPAQTPAESALIAAMADQTAKLNAILDEIQRVYVLQSRLVLDTAEGARAFLERHGFQVLPGEPASDTTVQDRPAQSEPTTNGRGAR